MLISMQAEMDVGTNKKAFQINLDTKKYGTFAEIGAGQEVARRFFHVGGAAGTIAKTMSAYDMTFSDAIYGPTDRYVSRVRLQTMLDHEYKLLIERLDAKFGGQRTFFVFADTVAARSFKQPTSRTAGSESVSKRKHAASRARSSSTSACSMKPMSITRKRSASSE